MIWTAVCNALKLGKSQFANSTPGTRIAFHKRGEKYVNLAHAEYLLLDWTGAGWTVTFHRIPYDLAALKAGILASRMPHAGWLADEWVTG